jgi:protein-tyrosine phosphatase
MTDQPAASPTPAVRISCVCLGNICRSPMAAAILADRATGAGVRVVVESAGTSDWHVGGPAHPDSRAELARHGIPSEHVARTFDARDLERLDLVLAMDHANRANLIARASGTAAARKIHLIRAFDPSAPADAEVPDPYGHGPETYREVFRMLAAACTGLVRHIARHGAPPWADPEAPA